MVSGIATAARGAQPVAMREQKTSTIAYVLWLVFGAHYLYFERPGVQLLYWVTCGGGGIWALIDLFRIPSMVAEWNGGYSNDRSFREQQAPARSLLPALACLAVVALLVWVNREPIMRVLDATAPGRSARGRTPTPRPIPASPEARARAVARFPELARAGSALNRAFVELAHQAQIERPEIFDDPEWPMQLALEAFEKVR